MHSDKLRISTKTHHVPQQSDQQKNRFVFAYTITIENIGVHSYQLMSRHWIIQDGNMKVEEVVGDGVVGEQPVIEPGESYSYTSGAVLETDMGTMEGRYFFRPVDDLEFKDAIEFDVTIPKFLLTIPRTVH